MVRKETKELSTDSRKTAFRILWDQQENGRPRRGSVSRIAAQFNVDRRTITRLWREHKNKIDEYVNNHNGEPVDEGDIRNLINDLTFYQSGRHLSGRKMNCQAYVAYNSNKINRIWLSLMSCLNESVEHHGDINYKIPHIGKERLERIGELPITLPVCDVAVQYFT